jgi:hypothetical protein
MSKSRCDILLFDVVCIYLHTVPVTAIFVVVTLHELLMLHYPDSPVLLGALGPGSKVGMIDNWFCDTLAAWLWQLLPKNTWFCKLTASLVLLAACS